MKLSKKEIKDALAEWTHAWEKHDLNKVMHLFHDDIFFENWTGAYIKGKKTLFREWEPWFKNHQNFRFIEEEIFIDEQYQKVLYRWILEWPSLEPGYEGKPEIRKGVDILHFKDGKIINKLTYSKTAVEIDNQRMRMQIPVSRTSA